jgi:hypothetical protein
MLSATGRRDGSNKSGVYPIWNKVLDRDFRFDFTADRQYPNRNFYFDLENGAIVHPSRLFATL